MPVLDVVVNPSGALSGARTVQRSLDDIGRSAVGMERTMGGAVGRLKGMLVRLVAAVGLKNLAKGFLDAAVTVQNYQTSLQGVIKNAEETKRVFDDINKWAALNPVDTDDAIRGFVLLKSAAVKNTKEAVEAAADLATVMQVQISDVASAVVSLNTIQLRRLGILLDQTGSKAIIQSGNVRKEVEKDTDSIRAGLISLIQENFGGMMQYAGNTWSAVMKTMGGQWNFLQQAIMGSVGSGGPFDRLNQAVIGIRDRWNDWMQSEDFKTFVERVQGAVMRAIDSLLSLGDKIGKVFGVALENVDKIISGLKALAAYKISGALLALLGLPGGAVAAGVGTLVYLSDQFETVQTETERLEEQVKRLEERSNSLGIALRDALSMGNEAIASGIRRELTLVSEELEGLRAAAKLAAYDAAAVLRQSGSVIAGKGVLPTPAKTPEPDSVSRGGSSGPSAAERLVSSIRDQMKYLYAEGKSFLPVLDEWARKLKPLSEDWKKIVDLQRDIRSDESTKAADEAAAAMERLAEKERQQAEALEAARAGVQKFWAEMSWANQQGLMTDENYFDMLVNDFNNAKARLDQAMGGMLDLSNWANWTEEMKTTFASMQSVASQIASTQMSTLNEQLEKGVLTQKEWNAAVQELLDKYSALPAVVAQVNNAQKNTKKTSDEFGISAKLWANELSQGLAQAIVNAQDLGDALRNIAKSIAGSVLQKLIGKLIGGLFADGAAFQGGRVIPFAKGGIVTKPTIFPMARGMGLMGEAGPEAVMPLKRTADGSLGVTSEGGGGTHITMNINAVDSRSFVEMMRSNRASVESIVVENIMKNGAVRSAIRGLA